MIQTTNIDERLRAAVERGDVPGVVAMAATRDEVVYQAACGATPTMVARASDQKCSLADFAAQVETEVSPAV